MSALYFNMPKKNKSENKRALFELCVTLKMKTASKKSKKRKTKSKSENKSKN